MAREKGTGNLQMERGGRWTMRYCVDGKRCSRSTGTADRAKAELCLARRLASLGRGRSSLPLAGVWEEYVKSPRRRDLADSSLNVKRRIWQSFARWMAHNHLEVGELSEVSSENVAEYLACLRREVCASTYNGRVCALREIFRCLADKAGAVGDPWSGVALCADDGHSRRDFGIDELTRLMDAAKAQGREWQLLFAAGLYTGLRLGDCCRLEWRSVDIGRGTIQLVPAKTRRHAHGRPVTIPIHPALGVLLDAVPVADRGERVLSELSVCYETARWKLSRGLAAIFRAANIETSVRLDGRRRLAPEATFHSLRHTFVSLAVNAGVPLAVVAAIVGHGSSAMTRHYYHESETALRRAVSAIPCLP